MNEDFLFNSCAELKFVSGNGVSGIFVVFEIKEIVLAQLTLPKFITGEYCPLLRWYHFSWQCSPMINSSILMQPFEKMLAGGWLHFKIWRKKISFNIIINIQPLCLIFVLFPPFPPSWFLDNYSFFHDFFR